MHGDLYYMPFGWAAALAALVALAASIGYLRTRNPRFDAVARASTAALLVYLAMAIMEGCRVIHSSSGKWWTWDAHLAAALVCWLLYATCLMLRSAVDDPSRRAAFAAVWTIFACLDVPLVVATAAWWKPGTALPFVWNWPSYQAQPALVPLAGLLIAGLWLRARSQRKPAG